MSSRQDETPLSTRDVAEHLLLHETRTHLHVERRLAGTVGGHHVIQRRLTEGLARKGGATQDAADLQAEVGIVQRQMWCRPLWQFGKWAAGQRDMVQDCYVGHGRHGQCKKVGDSLEGRGQFVRWAAGQRNLASV